MSVDAHAHLTDARFGADLDTVLSRARAAGIRRVLTCGEDVASSEAATAVARREPMVRAAVGVHPHRAASLDDAALMRLRDLAADPRVVAIGEIGIDLSGRSAPPEAQERAFAAQLGLAAELDMPVVVHVRDSGDEVRAILDRSPRVRGQVHCYSEGAEEIDPWVARGMFVSFAGTVTFSRAERLRDAARVTPADRILVETDAPYLAPEPYRGRRNEPAFVVATLAFVAALRGTDADTLAARVGANARALFGERWD